MTVLANRVLKQRLNAAGNKNDCLNDYIERSISRQDVYFDLMKKSMRSTATELRKAYISGTDTATHLKKLYIEMEARLACAHSDQTALDFNSIPHSELEKLNGIRIEDACLFFDKIAIAEAVRYADENLDDEFCNQAFKTLMDKMLK